MVPKYHFLTDVTRYWALCPRLCKTLILIWHSLTTHCPKNCFKSNQIKNSENVWVSRKNTYIMQKVTRKYSIKNYAILFLSWMPFIRIQVWNETKRFFIKKLQLFYFWNTYLVTHLLFQRRWAGKRPRGKFSYSSVSNRRACMFTEKKFPPARSYFGLHHSF